MRKSLLLSLAFISGLFASETSTPMEHQAQVEQASSCVSNDHSGFYIGAAVGASLPYSKLDINKQMYKEVGVNTTLGTTSSGKSNKTGFAGGVNLGYGFQIGKFYIAPELEFLMHTAKVENKFIFSNYTGPLDGQNVTNINGEFLADIKYKWQASFCTKFGYVVGNTIPYLKLGVSSLQTKTEFKASDFNVTSTTGVSASKKTNHIGLIFGGGVEHAICKNISLTADVSYTMHNKIKDIDGSKGSLLTGLVGLKFKI